jgi:hypothetical protein
LSQWFEIDDLAGTDHAARAAEGGDIGGEAGLQEDGAGELAGLDGALFCGGARARPARWSTCGGHPKLLLALL